MRTAIYVAAVLALALCDPQTGRAMLAAAASTCFEALPYLVLTAALVQALGPRVRAAIAYLGCGCDGGPGARSVPAAIATAVLFGPYVALARLAAATFVARVLPQRDPHEHGESLLDALQRLAPSAAVAAVAATLLPLLRLGAQPAALQVLGGVALGFATTPCALGGVAVAAALRPQSTLAAAAFLCVAGIVDLRTWYRPHRAREANDPLAYALLGAAAALVAARGGASFVHPHFALLLGGCAVASALLAWRTRNASRPHTLWIPAAMLAAVVIGAPAPYYTATETTLADAFAGERVDFTGMLVRAGNTPSLVRFAITCCRADAQPVAVVLSDAPHGASARWFHARGTLAMHSGTLVLRAQRLDPIAPPYDPFIYR